MEVEQKIGSVLVELQKKGVEELWAVNYNELKFDETDSKDGKCFASGAGGELFRVEWRGLDCVAKKCPLSVGERVLVDLANEIKILSTVRHPNLIMFLGACFEPSLSSPVLLMEFCSGGNLETKLCRLSNQDKKLSQTIALSYSLQLALGVNFLHQCVPPIVHRDLKPSNILLSEGNQVKITDFGLSKFIPKKTAKQIEKFKMTGETGSYRFMAPEVFKHEEYDEKVDVYSFGLINYWMLSGNRPFPDLKNGLEAAKQAALKKRTPNEKDIKNVELRTLLATTWNYNADDRPNLDEIIIVLKRLKKRNSETCIVC